MSSVTTSQIIPTGSVAQDRTSARSQQRRQIETINRHNYRADVLVKSIAIFLMSAVAVSFVSLIGFACYELIQQVAALEFQDLGRIAVGY